MNPYLDFVKSIQAGIDEARSLSVSGKTEPLASDSTVLLFSPHPDDECITGLLPLRLMRETGRRVVNIPVTFGSNVERQSGRAAELQDACEFLGFGIHQDRDNYASLDADGVARTLREFQPEIIFMPHKADWNSRHISTHLLVMEALASLDREFSCVVVETEYWGAMSDPNLLVEGDAESVADLVGAISLHAGEVARNPYHLLLPAWMQDNVRRGGELVGGQGGVAPDFSFATLYRVSMWQGGEHRPELETGAVLPIGEDFDALF
ncbi:MAG: PIG-L family deacetylase [Gammaproteobacteria bacterium]|jgi:LmbE family N-acetylglucosaminyl deacetylase|nr:PIG-L family deacetylase [Gammaproteobacteria bacterium]